MRFCLGSICVVALLAVMAFQAHAAQYPAQDGHVTDLADLLSAATESTLETDLQQYQDSTRVQIAVATINSLQGEDIDRYAQDLGNAWGVGDTATSNGVIIVVAKNDRELAVWFGDGYPKSFSDQTADYLVSRVLIPRFKQGQPEQGIVKAVGELEQRLTAAGYSREYWKTSSRQAPVVRQTAAPAPAPPAPVAQRTNLAYIGGLLGLVLLGSLLIAFLVQRSRRQHLLADYTRTAEELQQYLDDIKRLEEGLKENFPAAMWEEPLARLRTDTLEKLLFANPAKLPTSELSGLLDQCRVMANSAAAVVKLAQDAPVAQQESKRMFGELPRQMDVVQAALDHPDVLPETKAALDKARGDLADRERSIAGLADKEVNWVSVHADLMRIAGEVSAIQQQAAENKERAVRARTEIPQLLEQLPGQLQEMRRSSGSRYGDVDAALDAAEELLGRAQRTSYRDDDVTSLLLMHSMLENAQNRYATATQAVEEHQRASSSSYSGGSFGSSGGGSSGSWGGSSSGGSFGGGGGGGGGGGRSGRW